MLREIAEIVHDADLMDEKYARPEFEGLDAIVRGMQLSLSDDLTLSVHTDVLYDGLYTYLSSANRDRSGSYRRLLSLLVSILCSTSSKNSGPMRAPPSKG